MPALNTEGGLLERETLPPSTSTDLSSGEIAAIVIGVVTAVAAILALFKGWKFWKKKKAASVREQGQSSENGGHKLFHVGGGVNTFNTTINNQINSYAATHIIETDGRASSNSTAMPKTPPRLHLASP
ncbi:hypothetical protein L873DRAFT_1809446 [Choiromyces venosus 120613-1]|uniref:Uncharacterized protein n=1 Tax=Choiromyces venosus 120613-1 TaxID=1336337 RepID=A0A3N4JHG6_9PEZI|nr:hypothetical protein L873DRAFT_1809446 [Choiromyces venosus 120613-1]